MTSPYIYLTVLITAISLKAQSQTYSLTTSTDPYIALSAGISMNENNADTFNINTIYSHVIYEGVPIGFDFEFLGQTFDTLRMSENGFATFWNDTLRLGFISFFDSDLDNFSGNPALSPINYSLEGTPGDQIFKCEIVNSGFANDTNSLYFVNAQLWLYENCNKFEVRIGESNATPSMLWNSNSSPYVGYGSYSSNELGLLTGDPTNPILLQSPSAINTMNAIPATGMVYTFSSCSVSLQSNSAEISKVYPNPVVSQFTIDLNELNTYSSISILNLQGDHLKELMIDGNSKMHLDLNEFSAGSYLVVLYSEKGSETHRIVKISH